MSFHVLIAGGSSGIGASCRDVFLEKGWLVTSVARRPQQVDPDFQKRFFGVVADLTSPDAAVTAMKQASTRLGPVTSVVHSVGDIGKPLALEAMDWQRWQATYDLNVGTAVRLVQAALPALIDAKENGSITFIASVAARKPYPGIADYCAAKAAIVSLTRSLATELAPSRGRSNCVSPAVVRTPIFERAPFDEATAASWHQLGRIGEAEEIAKMVAFLCSENARWITGQDYIIDGGMLL